MGHKCGQALLLHVILSLKGYSEKVGLEKDVVKLRISVYIQRQRKRDGVYITDLCGSRTISNIKNCVRAITQRDRPSI